MIDNNSRCKFKEQYASISGKPVVLKILKYDENTAKVIVRNTSINSYKKNILVLFIVVLNLFCTLTKVISMKYSLAIFVVTIFYAYKILYHVKRESLLVVRSLGFQIEVTYTLGRSSHFIPWKSVQDIFINEVITKQRVLFVLTIITKDSVTGASKLIPLFMITKPRLECLEVIYQNIYKLKS